MRVIEVVPHRPEWFTSFAEEAARISQGLNKTLVRIHHIGSTAIPGLAAKPIIDILLEVSSLAELDEAAPSLAALDYEAKGAFGIERRRYFQKGGDARTHQIHAFAIDDPHIVRHLAFRD